MSFTTRRIRGEAPRRAWNLVTALSVLRFVGPPMTRWYHAWKARQKAATERAFRLSLLKRALLLLLAAFFVFLLFAGIAKALISLRLLTMPGILNAAGTELAADENGFTNFLLLGQGDASHDGKDLTDTVMVVSLDPKRTKSAVLLSLPRDLYFLDTEKMGKGRINSMYRDYKGFLMARKDMEEPEASLEAMKELGVEVGKALDLEIHHVIKVDFDGFTNAVDAIGGIDVEVPEAITDTEYPGPNYTYETFKIEKGLQHLDGETALKYARSRHTTSDFNRSARQQQILAALADRVRSKGILRSPSKVMELYKIVSQNLEITLTLRELVGAGGMGSAIDRNRIIAMQLSDRNGLYGTLSEPGGFLYDPPRDLFEGASVLLPVSIPEFPITWKQMHTLTELLFRNRALFMRKPRINVLNAGARSGLGRTLGSELVRYGLAIDRIENAGIPKVERSFLFAENDKDKHIAAFLSALLKIPTGAKPANVPPENVGDITIILGKDYSYVPMQELVPGRERNE